MRRAKTREAVTAATLNEEARAELAALGIEPRAVAEVAILVRKALASGAWCALRTRPDNDGQT